MARKVTGGGGNPAAVVHSQRAPMDFRFTPGFRDARLRATRAEARFIEYIVNGILARKFRGMITCRLDHKQNAALIQEWPSCAEIAKFGFSELDLAPWRPALLVVAKIGTYKTVLGVPGEDDSDLADPTGQLIGACRVAQDK